MYAAVERERELGLLIDAYTAAARGTAGFVDVNGDAGIGKSTLLAAFRGDVAERGATVWGVAPTRPERELAWTGLAAILAHARSDDVQALGAAAVHLNAVALAHSTDPVVPHRVALAFADLARAVARRGPLVIVVDDAQWLDVASAAALSFVARSVTDEPFLIVAGRRSAEAASLTPPSDPGGPQALTVKLGGLTTEAIGNIVLGRVGLGLTRSDAVELSRRVDGNPLYAIEIAELLANGAQLRDATMPTSLAELLRARVAALPTPTLRVVQIAALCGDATTQVVGRAVRGDAMAVIGPGETAGVVELVNVGTGATTIRFTHPLLAAAAIDLLSTSERLRLHRLLADVADEDASRCLHLAESVDRSDEAIAVELERAAGAAKHRGALHVAIRLLDAAVRSSECPADVLRRRQIALARLQIDVMHHGDALATIDSISVSDGSHDAISVATMRAIARSWNTGVATARAELAELLTQARDPVARANVHRIITILERLDSLERGLGAAVAWKRFATRTWAAGSVEVAMAELHLASSRALAGLPVDTGAIIELVGRMDDAAAPNDLTAVNELTLLLWALGDARGVDSAESLRARGVVSGDTVFELNGLRFGSWCLMPRGEWAAAERALREQLLILPRDSASEWADLAYVLASTGRVAESSRILSSLGSSERTRGRTNVLIVQARRGMAKLAAGTPDAADALVLARELADDVGLGAPRTLPFRRDLVEALVAAGRIDEAGSEVDRLAVLAERSGLSDAKADADAAAGVVEAAIGHHDQAEELLTVAAKLHDHSGLAYEHARTTLAAGRAARRAGRRSNARRLLAIADSSFIAMGCKSWAATAQAEAARLGGRPQRTAELTPTERQVARHAAAGRSNAEIAATMFISVRTVESNLTRTYRKLGVRTRFELARLTDAFADE